MFGSIPPALLAAIREQKAATEASATSRGPQLAAVLGIFLGLTWIFTGLRVYVRLLISKNWAADDNVLMMSLISFSLFCASSLAGIAHGTGRHVDAISPVDLPRALMFWWACELLYTLTTALLRLSMSIFLLRICVKKVHKIIIYGTMTVVLLFSTFYFFLVVFQCKPVNYFWNQYAGESGSCISPQWVPDSTLAHSAISATADWILGLMPIFLIKDLQMNIRTKISVGAVMSLGVLAGIATVVRIPFVQVLSITDDFLFATVDVAIWSTVEPGVGIIALDVLALRPLFKKFYGLSSNGTSKNSNHGSPGSKSPTSHTKEKLSGDSDTFEGFDEDAVEIGMARSTNIVQGGHNKDAQSYKKAGSFFPSRNQSSTSSEEDKTPRWQVQVEKTVEVRTQNRESKGSLKSIVSGRNEAWSGEKM